jgi:hypothetical protein
VAAGPGASRATRVAQARSLSEGSADREGRWGTTRTIGLVASLGRESARAAKWSAAERHVCRRRPAANMRSKSAIDGCASAASPSSIGREMPFRRFARDREQDCVGNQPHTVSVPGDLGCFRAYAGMICSAKSLPPASVR